MSAAPLQVRLGHMAAPLIRYRRAIGRAWCARTLGEGRVKDGRSHASRRGLYLLGSRGLGHALVSVCPPCGPQAAGEGQVVKSYERELLPRLGANHPSPPLPLAVIARARPAQENFAPRKIPPLASVVAREALQGASAPPPARRSRAGKSHAEQRPEVVALVKALRRRKPKGGQMGLRAISAELAAQGHLNERGKPFNPNSIVAIILGGVS